MKRKRMVLMFSVMLVSIVAFFTGFSSIGNKASAGACYCKDDPEDTCTCYGQDIEDCDETWILGKKDCNS